MNDRIEKEVAKALGVDIFQDHSFVINILKKVQSLSVYLPECKNYMDFLLKHVNDSVKQLNLDQLEIRVEEAFFINYRVNELDFKQVLYPEIRKNFIIFIYLVHINHHILCDQRIV